ncbi:MAG: response regulator [Polyangiaceae bacterium]|jgi:DNA-binding response OmpR family regulator
MSSDDKRTLAKIPLQRKLVSHVAIEDGSLTSGDSISREPATAQPAMDGNVEDLETLRTLSEKHGVPGIDLAQIAIVLDHLDVVSREVADSHRVLPVLVRGDRIFLAMETPGDKAVIDELEFVTGKKVYPYIAVPKTLVETIAAAYAAKARGERHYLGPRVPAETLIQLGLTPSAPTAAVRTSPSAPTRGGGTPSLSPSVGASAPNRSLPPTRPQYSQSKAPPSRQPPPLPRREPASAPEPAPPVVVLDDATESLFQAFDVSTGEFGQLSEELSSVTALPQELRAGASLAARAIAGRVGKLVLVVDDEEEIRTLLRRLLAQAGYRVIEADRGLLALRLVKEHVPDLIILDAMLPELHGFDIARRIKKSEKYGHIPIIMVSAVYRGWRIAEDLKQNYGVEEYIEKPFRIADVTEAVERLLAQAANPSSAPARDAERLSADAEHALREGIAAYKAGQHDDAVKHLKHGTEIDPLAYRLHFHLALLYGKMGQIYAGIQELERAIELNPKHFAALRNLAVLYEKAGFKNKAIEMWERSALCAPDEMSRMSIREHLVKLI